MKKMRVYELIFLFVSFLVSACANEKYNTSRGLISPVGVEFASNEPSNKAPMGLPNKNAPVALNQYSFMIGEWSCDEQFRQQDGSWSEVSSLVRGNYFLNGAGIMNHTFLPNEAAVMTYIYDAEKNHWRIVNFKSASATHTEWLGIKTAGGMRATLVREEQEQGAETAITFYNIQPQSFDWKLEVTTPGGVVPVRTKKCIRMY